MTVVGENAAAPAGARGAPFLSQTELQNVHTERRR